MCSIGCSAPAQGTAKNPATDDEYVTIQSTGSLLPRRIKKSQAKQENITVEGPDSPTLQQIEKNQFMQTKPKGN